eukprot:1300152-Rhodomonas_salina.1
MRAGALILGGQRMATPASLRRDIMEYNQDVENRQNEVKKQEMRQYMRQAWHRRQAMPLYGRQYVPEMGVTQPQHHPLTDNTQSRPDTVINERPRTGSGTPARPSTTPYERPRSALYVNQGAECYVDSAPVKYLTRFDDNGAISSMLPSREQREEFRTRQDEFKLALAARPTLQQLPTQPY